MSDPAMQMRTLALWACASLASVSTAGTASAFCGFYLGGDDADLYNDATMVVMLRDGTRTVLSMRNDYAGPPEDFAMVVPVPEVLRPDDVKTLPTEIFDEVETLTAPRLVEYWEQAPYCMPPATIGSGFGFGGLGLRGTGRGGGGGYVRVEAQFAVGEYDIVVLGSDDSALLETWLRREGYRIPADAARLLRPYVEAGTKFFVAKVDVSRVQFVDGRARLSPLRISYESEELTLPIRLGLINSRGTQDLLVHVLARQRYEVANYDNVTIPTNLVVRNGVRRRFGAFYAALFDRVLEENPGAVVTEYAWNAGWCDPCPGPMLDQSDYLTLGADVLPPESAGQLRSWTLTRLHARFGEDTLGEDLVFREAHAISGGRGTPDARGRMDQNITRATTDTFQARYAILHRYTGPRVRCAEHRLIHNGWGGPPLGIVPRGTYAALDLSKVRRGVRIERWVRHRVPAIDLIPDIPPWMRRSR